MKTSTLTAGEKPATTQHQLLDVIQNRWSPRAFDNRPIPREVQQRLFEAARWAASSMNTQPWRFIIATQDNPEQFQTMLGLLKESNQEWAQNAGMLIIAVAKKQHDSGSDNKYAWHDTGMALAQLTLQATTEDLYIHMMGGYYPEKAIDVYNIPDDYEPVVALAVGYYGDPEDLSEKYRQREVSERSRKPMSELLFEGTWANIADIAEDKTII